MTHPTRAQLEYAIRVQDLEPIARNPHAPDLATPLSLLRELISMQAWLAAKLYRGAVGGDG